jgi:hypothetical protein
MLRELSTVLHELHDGLAGTADMGRLAGVGLRLSAVDMTLPMDVVPVLRDGSCVLLADVPRTQAGADWRDRPSRLHLRWQAQPAMENEANEENEENET